MTLERKALHALAFSMAASLVNACSGAADLAAGDASDPACDGGPCRPGDGSLLPDTSVDGGKTSDAADASADVREEGVVVATFAPCAGAGGGRVLYLNGDVGDYIHPGPVTIVAATWKDTPHGGSRFELQVHPLATTQGDLFIVQLSTERLGTSLSVGVYEGAERAPFASAGKPGLEVLADSRGCNGLSGRFQILSLVPGTDGSPVSIEATFEQHCEKGPPALRGCLRWAR